MLIGLMLVVFIVAGWAGGDFGEDFELGLQKFLLTKAIVPYLNGSYVIILNLVSYKIFIIKFEQS